MGARSGRTETHKSANHAGRIVQQGSRTIPDRDTPAHLNAKNQVTHVARGCSYIGGSGENAPAGTVASKETNPRMSFVSGSGMEVGVLVGGGTGVGVLVGGGTGVGVLVGGGTGVGVSVGGGTGVGVLVGGSGVGVSVGPPGVAVGVGDRVAVGVLVGPVAVGVGVNVGVRVRTRVRVAVGVTGLGLGTQYSSPRTTMMLEPMQLAL